MGTPAVVSVDWLKGAIDSEAKIRVLDVSISTEQDCRKDYISAHIPGAQYFNILQDVETSADFPWNIPTVAAFQKQSRDLGVDDDTHVVVYDNTGNCGFFFGSRAWWIFRLYGHHQVSVLDGAMKAWTDAGHTVVAGEEAVQAGNLTAHYDASLIRHYDDMLDNLQNKAWPVVDTRPPPAFNGTPGDKKTGHIPGTKNVFFGSKLLDKEHNRLRSKEELVAAFTDVGVDVLKPVTMSCTTGRGACTGALAAYVCGNAQVPVYLGSFTEWKNRSPPEMIEQS